MARLNQSAYIPDRLDEVELLIGPVDDYTEEQLRTAWEAFRDRLMDSRRPRLGVGQRPWAYWRFELCEDRPSSSADETVRLAELGELSSEEVASLRERATEARLRIGTPGELISGNNSYDQPRVDLWERVEAALR